MLEAGEELKRQRNQAGGQLRCGHRLSLRGLVGGFGRHARAGDLENLLGAVTWSAPYCWISGAAACAIWAPVLILEKMVAKSMVGSFLL